MKRIKDNSIDLATSIVLGVIADIIPIPGAGATIQLGRDRISNALDTVYDSFEYKKILSKYVSDKLLIKDYDFVITQVGAGLKAVHCESYDQTDFQADLFKKSDYNPEIISDSITEMLQLKDSESGDVRKALLYIFSVYLVHWTEEDEFALDLLRRSISYEKRIKELEEAIQKTNTKAKSLLTKEYWLSVFCKYQTTLSIYRLLFEKGSFIPEILPDIENEDKTTSLIDYVCSAADNKESKHIYINGIGGAGKTVSLLYLNKTLLNKNILSLYIPLNRLQGNDDNQIKTWIINNVLIYDSQFNDMSLSEKYENFIVMLCNSRISLFLLLDGVNEVPDNTLLASELSKWNSLPNVSIIVSSRNNEFYSIGENAEYEYKKILNLSEEKIIACLKDKLEYSIVTTPLLIKILSIPQMLTLYIGNSIIKNKYKNTKWLDWKEDRNISDIVHNFFICQIADIVYEKHLCSIFEGVFAIRYILPALSWSIYKSNKKSLSLRDILSIIKEETNSLISKEKEQEGIPIVLAIKNHSGKEMSVSFLTGLILDHLSLLDEFANGRFWFVHQNYFEYLVSAYWRNSAENTVVSVNANTCWNTDILPTFIEQYYSNTEGKYSESDADLLNRFCKRLRNKQIDKSDNSLFNLVVLLERIKNWDLSDVDFSELDLRYINLNGARLSNDNSKATFRRACISENTFSPQGHHAAIMQVFTFHNNPSILYTRDLHGVIGVYDLRTEKKIKMKRYRSLGGSKNIALAASTPDQFMIPMTHTFLGSRLTGMLSVNLFNEDDSKQISPGSIHPFWFVVIDYIAPLGKWMILNRIDNKIYIVTDGNNICENSCICNIPQGYRFFRLISNSSQTIILLQLINKDSELIIKVDINNDEYKKIYEGAFVIGNSNTSLSNDATILAISKDNATVSVLKVADFSVFHELKNSADGHGGINGNVLISDDKQWCVWIGCYSRPRIIPFKVYIWNLSKMDLVLSYEFNDIVSSSCFTPDSKLLILGLFNGSIETINLDSFQKHHMAIGHRVDQKMFDANGKLVVRRSDDYFQFWDIENRIICGEHQKYDFLTQRYYNISSSGEYWYSSLGLGDDGFLKIWNKDTHKIEYIDKFSTGNNIISNEINNCIIEVNYQDYDLSSIKYCKYDFSTYPIKGTIKRITIPENINGTIKKIHFTNNMKYLVILFTESEVSKHIDPSNYDLGRPKILIWDLVFERQKSLFSFDLKVLYMNQEYEICSFGDKILVCFYHPISFFVISTLEENTINHYEIPVRPNGIITTLSIDEISCVTIKQKEDDEGKTKMTGSFMISPNGTIITDSRQGYNESILEPNKEIEKVPIGALQLYCGDAMCCTFLNESTIAIGCNTGIVLIVDLSQNNTECVALIESNERVVDIVAMSGRDGNKYLLAAQKDDNIYIWNLDTYSYVGFLRSIPGSDIYQCDFREAIFESEGVKSLIIMNGGIVNESSLR